MENSKKCDGLGKDEAKEHLETVEIQKEVLDSGSVVSMDIEKDLNNALLVENKIKANDNDQEGEEQASVQIKKGLDSGNVVSMDIEKDLDNTEPVENQVKGNDNDQEGEEQASVQVKNVLDSGNVVSMDVGKDLDNAVPVENQMKGNDNDQEGEEQASVQIKKALDSGNVVSMDTEKDLDNAVPVENQVKGNDNDQKGEEQTSEKHGLYSYTKLNDFTSEIYKIEINNLPNYIGYGQLKKLLNVSLKLNTCKIKAIGSPPHLVFTTFRNEADRDNALKLLNGYVWKGKTLFAKKANPAVDPMAKKRKAGDSEDCSSSKKQKEDDIPIELKLKNAVTPYWDVPYEEQLKRKENDVHKFLVTLGRSIEKTNKSFKLLLLKNRKENNNQCCPCSAIKPSPVTTAYRNKCEFTVGRHLHTRKKTVGFRLNSYKAGSMSVAEPDDCINISKEMINAVKSFQYYIRYSNKDVYNPEDHGGYWRQLTVRTSNNCDILLIVVMHPQLLSDKELNEEKSKLKEYYEIGHGSSYGITSVYFQPLSKRECSDGSPNLTHLMGKKCLEETVLGMQFEISPEAFFQVNVPAAEVLYSLVSDYAQASSESTVLDVCCGTGTISICLAKAGAKVIGIEKCPEAVGNARLNAKNNGVTNVEFICGKAEDVIMTAVNKCDDSTDIIAVVDPPRAGLHQKVLKIIRATTRIKKLIYVACNPTSAKNNFVDLCRPPSNNYKGDPFYPKNAAVVDMFPHTPHKELVLVFERSP